MTPSRHDRRTFLGLLGAAATGVGVSATASAGSTSPVAARARSAMLDGEWSHPRGGPGLSGHVSGIDGPASDLTMAWTVDVGQAQSRPVYGGGRLYLAGERVLAVSEAGNVVWERTIDRNAVGATYHDGYLAYTVWPDFESDAGPGIFVHDAESGEPEWSFEADAEQLWGLPHGDRVYAVSIQGEEGAPETVESTLTALDLEDGTTDWSQTVPPMLPNQVSLDGERLFGVTFDVAEEALDRVSAYDLDDGELAWEADLSLSEDQFFVQPIAANGHVYVIADGTLLGLDAETGDEAFTYEYDRPVTTFLSATAERVFVASQEGRLLVHDAETGEDLWASDEDEWINDPTLTDSLVYAGREGTVFAYSHSDREAVSSVDVGGFLPGITPTEDALYTVDLQAEELVAIREGATVDEPVDAEDEGGDDGSEAGDTGGDDDGGSDEQSDDDAQASADDEDQMDDDDDASEGMDDDADADADDDADADADDDADADADDGETDDGGTGGDDDSVPGFGAIATLAGLGSAAGWLARTRVDDDGDHGESTE